MDGAGNEPGGRPVGGLSLTRRVFMGSAGAGAALLGSPVWSTEQADAQHDQRLTYDWITDPDTGAELLEVHLVTRDLFQRDEKNNETPAAFAARELASERGSGISWRINPRAFGPDARIVLFRSPTPGLRDRLVIRNVGYGRLARRRITFIFERREMDVPSGGKLRRIVMEMDTTVWSSERGATRQREFWLEAENRRPRRWLLFREFAAPAGAGADGARKESGRFAQTIPAIRVANTAKLMFNGLVTAVPGLEDRLVEVIFDKTQTWTVQAKKRLAAIGGQVALQELTVAWALDKSNAADGQVGTSEQKEAALLGRATADATEADGLRLGAAEGPTLAFDESNTKTLKLLFRSGGADPDQVAGAGDGAGQAQLFRAEAVLARTWKGAHFYNGNRIGKVGTLPDLDGSVLERIDARGPVTEAGLNALSGSISFQARYAKAAAERDAESPIGRLTLGRLADRDDGEEVTGEFPSRRGWPVTALWSWSVARGRRQAPVADLIDAGVALIEAGIMLPGSAWSRLTFAETELRIHYNRGGQGTPPLGSHLDLGATDHVGLAVLDLSRARLRASQSDQLLALSFRFSDLSLRFDRKTMTLVRSTPECTLAARPRSPHEGLTKQDRGADLADQVPHDNRPVLVVEFPPQHLFEEASFRPGRGVMPDVRLDKMMKVNRKTGDVTFTDEKPRTYTIDNDTIRLDPDRRSHVVDALAALATNGTSKKVRAAFQAEKRNLDGVPEAEKRRREAFAKFADQIAGIRWRPPTVAAEQWIYIGPYAMDVDVMAKARRLFDRGAAGRAQALVVDMFAAISQERKRMGLSYPENDIDGALAIEVQLQSVVPLYQQFRTFYRNELLISFFGSRKTGLPAGDEATSAEPAEVEYIDVPDGHSLADNQRLRRSKAVQQAFLTDLQGAERLEGPKRGRLSNPSRLAFRVNCLDGIEAARAARRDLLDGPEDTDVRLPRSTLTFDLNELLRFRGMELAVTARAEIPYEPDAHGRIGGRALRLTDIAPGAMMSRLGFTRGPDTGVAQRLAEVAASLRAPTALETAIEMPARITLSPHQNAVVLTPQQPEGMEQIFDYVPDGCDATTGPVAGAVVRRLWAARFVTGQDGLDLDPGLRAVHSPDLRPAALLTRFAEGQQDAMPFTQPPGGAADPWFLSGTQSEATQLSEAELNKLFPDHVTNNRAVCQRADDLTVRDLPGIVRAFCRRMGWVRSRRELTFRNGLDARDRHQLVMLSSAWGLPISHARPGDTESTAQPEPEWQLWDVMPGNGLYTPRSLHVTELSLSALGGVLRHDTGFEAPTAPRFWRARNPSKPEERQGVYDAFSVERWQQWINLGRDIFTEVAYKGFLLPIGIRASLVKVTEREFWIDCRTGAITAPLRQRMFIRVARPEKLFPAVRQPNGGRAFPVRRLELLTTVTPDIVDPYADAATEAPAKDKDMPSGRLVLDGARGLMFWPRTLKAIQGDIRFEMTLDGVRSDMPLIFADQTAVADLATMKALVDYYAHLTAPPKGKPVDPINHRRTLQLHGAAMRYAPEVKAGSATFQTEHWTLKATAGTKGTLTGIESPSSDDKELGIVAMQHEDFDFDAVRQANDQPPIYPAIASARLYLTQTERLIGRKLDPVDAVFDGAFMRDGLMDVTEGNGNSAEVLLALTETVPLTMDNKGDQSGGVFRPAGHVVGLSRQKGALTLDLPPTVPESETGYVLPLLSKRFNDTKIQPASSPGQGPPPAAAQPADGGARLDELRKYYQSLLSSDAKICGLVSVKDLIGFCKGLRNPAEDAPSLTEALEFGGAGEVGAEQIRAEIIVPLAAAIRSVREEWGALEQRINQELAGLDTLKAVSATGKRAQVFEIKRVFPELFQSLADLDNALSLADGETDPVLFGFALGACYSAGMRFLNALERAASNPGQALDALVSQTVAELVGLLDILRGDFGSYLGPLFDNLANELGAHLKFAFEGIIKSAFKVKDAPSDFERKAALTRGAFLAFPRPGNMPDSWQNCLKNFLPSTEDAKAVLSAFVTHAVGSIVNGERPDASALVKRWLDDKDADKIAFDKEFDATFDVFRDELLNGIKSLQDEADKRIESGAPGQGLNPVRLLAELSAAADATTTTVKGIFPTTGNVDEFIQSGSSRERIAKYYIARVIYGLAEENINTCIADLPIGFPTQILDFLSSLKWDPNVGTSAIDIDLIGWFDPITQVLPRLARIIDALSPFNLTILLREFDGVLGAVGLSLPDCEKFEGIWNVIKQAMTQLAALAALTDPVPSDWTYPLRVKTLDPQSLSGRLPSVPLMLAQARGYLVQIREDLDEAKTNAGSLIDKLEGEEAAAARNALNAQVNNADHLRDRLGKLQQVYESAFDAVMRDTEALRQTVQSLNTAATAEVCSGKDPADALAALVNLPRDGQTLLIRREDMLQQLDKVVIDTREQLEDLRKEEALVPLFATVAEHFKGLGLPETDDALPAWAEPARAEIGALRGALDTASTHVRGLADSLASLLCQMFELAEKPLVQAAEAQQKISDVLSDARLAELPAETRLLGERMRSLWDAQLIAARLIEARQQLNRVRETCNGVTSHPHLGGLRTSFLAFAPESGMPPLTAARKQMRGVENALQDITANLRVLLETGPRKVAEKHLLNAAARILGLTTDGQIGNELAGKDDKLGVVPVYKRLERIRRDAWEAAEETGPLKDKLQAQLTVPRGPYRSTPDGANPPDDDRLAADVRMLAAFKPRTLTDEQRLFLHAFMREWATGQATPLLIGGNIADFVQDIFAGKLYRFIDFARLRREFEGRLLALVPTRQKLDYTFKLPLGPEVNAATMGIFRPAEGCKLDIGTSIQINLAAAVKDAPQGGAPLVSGSAVGTLGAFEIKLVGDLFDAITLRYGAARFEAPINGTPRFDITYLGHTIGPQLEFVQKLQSFLSPKDGSGAILRFDGQMPGVEAGYRLQLGDFAVGNLAFTNVGLEATAVLPFSDSPAVFKASLSSRAAPFTLTYAPYGGSGFFAILADVHGVIGFEASFEFGGSGVFGFGPLTGQGRLMSGVYIRQLTLNGMRLTEIAMTFFAGGSASIWIFNFTAALSVQMGMVNGSMSGKATFSFSFSMGLCDFKYSVSVSRSEGEGFSGGKRNSALGFDTRRFAGLGEPGTASEHENAFGARIENRAKCQAASWSTFKRYFDDNKLPEGYF